MFNLNLIRPVIFVWDRFSSEHPEKTLPKMTLSPRFCTYWNFVHFFCDAPEPDIKFSYEVELLGNVSEGHEVLMLKISDRYLASISQQASQNFFWRGVPYILLATVSVAPLRKSKIQGAQRIVSLQQGKTLQHNETIRCAACNFDFVRGSTDSLFQRIVFSRLSVE